MRKYILHVGMNKYVVNSRDAKKHARNHGKMAMVYTLGGKLVSMAMMDCNGRPYSCTVED